MSSIYGVLSLSVKILIINGSVQFVPSHVFGKLTLFDNQSKFFFQWSVFSLSHNVINTNTDSIKEGSESEVRKQVFDLSFRNALSVDLTEERALRNDRLCFARFLILLSTSHSLSCRFSLRRCSFAWHYALPHFPEIK